MVHDSLRKKEEFNNNKFYMWRCITTMAHADGLIHQDEFDYLTGIFSKMRDKGSLNQEAYDTLINDLSEPQNVSCMLAQINEPKYRGQVVYFARLLAHKDGNFAPSEEQLLKKLHTDVTGGIDLETIKKDIEYNVQKELILDEIEKDSKRPTNGISGLIDRIALAFDIDLMD